MEVRVRVKVRETLVSGEQQMNFWQPANMLQLIIFEHSHYGPRLAWQKHTTRKASDSSFVSYLDNSSSCHLEVVMSVKKM